MLQGESYVSGLPRPLKATDGFQEAIKRGYSQS